jgi:RHS repeat-associated protein
MHRLFILLMMFAISPLLWAVDSSLARETDENRSMGSVSGGVNVDPSTGIATASIPIDVPPGRNGMQPSISLVYESGGGNSWVGMGWKLEHQGIFRQDTFGVSYTNNVGPNAFLVKMAGLRGDLVEAPGLPGEWRAKFEGGFSRIQQIGSGSTMYWIATSRDGRKFYFGRTAASRLADPSDATKIFAWCLDKVADLDGNYMELTYWGDPTNNQGYLDQISYGGHDGTGGVTPKVHTHVIKFYRDAGTRPDQPEMYVANYRMKTKYLLKTIEVKANGNPVRAYELNYTVSPATSRSRLASVKQHGKDAGVDASGGITPGTSLPATTFSYSADSQIFTDGNAWRTGWCSGGTAYSGADFNGDGKQDIWCVNSLAVTQVLLSNGSGGFSSWAPDTSQTAAQLAADITGDGKSDILYVFVQFYQCPPLPTICGRSQYNVAVSNETGASTGAVWANLDVPLVPQLGDFNGDGKADLFLPVANTVRLSTGSSFSGSFWSLNNWCVGGTNRIADFTGDGRADLSCNNSAGTISVATSTGASFVGGGVWISSWCGSGQFDIADFNGDGKQDLSCHPIDGTTKIALSTGSAFVDGGNWVTGFCATGKFGTGDFNGDGKQDVYCHQSDGTTQVALSTGMAFTAPSTWLSSWCTTGTFGVGDFTGDGKTDVYCFNGGTVSVARSGAGLTAPDLLTSVSNGMGGTTSIAYTPSTTFQNTRLPFPLHVAISSTSSDGNGTVTTTSYAYKDGFYHLGEREFRGFNYVKVTGPAGPNGERSYAETWFHQGNDLVPPVTDPPNADVAIGYMKGKSYRTRTVDANTPSKIYSETITNYLADGDNQAPWFNPFAQVVNKIDNAAKETKIVYVSYDAYGNVTREDQYGDATGNNTVTNDDRTLVRTYANNTTAWLLGFPTGETIYQGIGTTTPAAQTVFYYDGTTSCETASTNQVPTLGHVTRAVRVHLTDASKSQESRTAYDSYGNKVCTRDAKGNTSTVTYDGTNTFVRTSTTPSPASLVTTTHYYGVDGQPLSNGLYGQVMSVTDPNGQVVSTAYDAMGRTVTTTVPGTPTNLVTMTTYPNTVDYGQIGTQKIVISTVGANLPEALVSRNFFDGLGRTIAEDKTGTGTTTIRTEQTYDMRGLVRTKTGPFFTGQSGAPRIIYRYDAIGRVEQITHADSTVTKVCYANWLVDTLDAKGHRTRETRDVYGRITKVEQYFGIGADCSTLPTTVASSVTYTYDVQGNVLTMQDHLNNTTTMTYNSLSQKIFMQDPDMGNVSYIYDLNGNLETQLDARNNKICFTYDSLNRRTRKNYGTNLVVCGTNTVAYTYDQLTSLNGKGRLTQVTDPSGTVKFHYDINGRVSKSEKMLDGNTYIFESSYDGLGRLKQVKYPTNPIKTVDYDYTGTGPFLNKVMEGATTYVQYNNYNALGQAGTETFGNGVVMTRTYHPQNFRLQTLNTVSAGAASTSAPTAPATLTATPLASSTSQIDLSWSAATDEVGVTGYRIERCQGVGCTNFVEIGTTAAGVTTFSNTGLLTGNPYTYRVRAIDGLNHLGPYSPLATAVPTDTTAPIQPSGVAMVVSTSQMNLTWTRPTEASQLVRYRVERCQGAGCSNFVQIATPTLTRHVDTGLTPATSYSYRIQALDYVGNASLYSPVYTKVTTLPADTSPPTAPGSLTVTPVPSNRMDLTWTAATDNVGLIRYLIEVCRGAGCSDFMQVATTDAATLTYSTGSNSYYWDGTSYSFRVRAYDAVGNHGVYSTVVTAVTTDSVNPTVPGTPIAMAQSPTQATLTWMQSTDLSRAVQYQVERCQGVGCTTFALVATVPVTTLTNTGLTAGTVYSYRVRGVDSTNHVSGYSGVATTTTASGTLQAMVYNFDDVGNMTGITDTVTPTNSQTLIYDDLDRLDQATGSYGFYDYAYDALGNMTTNPQMVGGTMTYPASGMGSIRPHAVSTAGGSTYTYDANGNMLTGAGRTFTWNEENKPLTIIQGGVTTAFVYDGDGGRVKKIVGNTTTRYISKFYECDVVSGSTSCSRYVWAGSERIAVVPDSTSAQNCNPACYYHTDHLGSSNVITSPTGTPIETMTYYPYGEVKSDSPGTPVNVPYKYTGNERDSSTGLYYYEARYYDPKLGRFISADTIIPSPRDPQDLNRYSYVKNNPYKYTDSTGHNTLEDFVDFFSSDIGRAIGWAVCPMCQQFIDPALRQYTVPVAVAVVGSFVCGPVCGGAASGAVSGFMSGGDIGRSTWMGAVSGVVSWGVGAGFNMANLGDYVVAQAFVAGVASGATHAALGGGDVLQAALIGGSIGAVSAYVQARGVAPERAQSAAGDAKTSLDLRTSFADGSPIEFMQVGNVRSEVVRGTIAISKDGVLTFNVRVSGLGAGGGLSARLQVGMLQWNPSGQSFVNFRDWGTSIPAHTIEGVVAKFGVSVSGITGPAYMRIIPQGLQGQPPVITNFGSGLGKYIPCGGGENRCGSRLNYDQAY